MKSMKQHMEAIYSPTAEVYSLYPPLPEKLQLELNETCNYSCVFCPFHSSFLKEQPEYGVMDIEFAKAILKKASSLGIGRKELALFATGEPLLYKRLAEVVSYAKKEGFPYVYITTNGSLASPDRINPIIDAGIDSIRFSINSSQESYERIHGTDMYVDVITNIKRLSKYICNSGRNVNLSVSFVETKDTIGQDRILEEALKEYIDEIVVFKARNLECISADVKEEYEILEKEKKKRLGTCAPLFNSMYIDSKGYVNLCCRDSETKIKIGKIDDDIDLEKAWHGKKYTEYRKKMLTNDLEETVCQDCYLRDIVWMKS